MVRLKEGGVNTRVDVLRDIRGCQKKLPVAVDGGDEREDLVKQGFLP